MFCTAVQVCLDVLFQLPYHLYASNGTVDSVIHDIPFREINVLKTKSCFEMVSSISLFGSTFTIFILFQDKYNNNDRKRGKATHSMQWSM